MKAILTYHSIDDSGSVVSIDPATFRSHIEWLSKSGVPVVSLQEMLKLSDDSDAVALTFDDGFENFETQAWPLLRGHGLGATVFVVTERVGDVNNWSLGPATSVPQLPLLSWSALERLSAQGVTIGAHTQTHPNLRSCSDAQLQDELLGAANTLHERLGVQADTFAYPYGAFDARVAAAAARTYGVGCTTELRAVRNDDRPLELPRLDTFYFRRPAMLDRFGTAAFRRYIWLRARGRGLRQALHAAAGR